MVLCMCHGHSWLLLQKKKRISFKLVENYMYKIISIVYVDPLNFLLGDNAVIDAINTRTA